MRIIAMLIVLCLMLCMAACGPAAPAETSSGSLSETTAAPSTEPAESSEPTINMEGAISIPDVDCSGGWQTGRADDITLTGDFELVYSFDYQGYLGIMNPWENMNSTFHDGQGTCLTIVCNGDGWQVGDKWLKPTNSFTVPENVDPMEILANAKGLVIYKRVGNKLTIDGTFTNGDLVGKWYAETDEPNLPETLQLRVGGEYSKMTNVLVKGIPEQPVNMEGADSLPDLDCSAGWNKDRADMELTGDFELTYTFNHQGYLGAKNPWENMNCTLFDDQGNFMNFVCNGDTWVDGGKWLRPINTFYVPDNVDTQALLENCQATVTFKRVGETFTINGTFTNGEVTGTWTAEANQPGLPETLVFRMGGEYCKLTNIKAIGIPEKPISMIGAEALADVDCSTGWMAAKTEPVVLSGDFDLTYSFDYAGYLGAKNPWENVVIEFYADGNWLTIVCNGDGWTVGDKWIKPTNTFTVPDNVDAQQILENAKALVNFKRVGNQITITGTFTNGDLVGVWTAGTDEPSLPETLNFHIGGEYCKLTNVKVKGLPMEAVDMEGATALPDVDCTPGWMTQQTSPLELAGDFELIYTFDYTGHLGVKSPWENMNAVITDSNGNSAFIVCNGDAWQNGNVLKKPKTEFIAPEGMAARDILSNAMATMIVKRVGNRITINATFVSGDLVGYWAAETDDPNLTETIRIQFGGEFSKMSNILVKGIPEA